MMRDWRESIEEFLCPGMVVVGIGNRLRGDDGFGPFLVDDLRGRVGWPLVDAGETPENHIGRIVSLSPERVLLLDAVAWGARPGEIGFFPSEAIPFDGVCTHSMSLRLFADMLTARADCRVGLLGIQPAEGSGAGSAAERGGGKRCSRGCGLSRRGIGWRRTWVTRPVGPATMGRG